jgi:hypothetical protein
MAELTFDQAKAKLNAKARAFFKKNGKQMPTYKAELQAIKDKADDAKRAERKASRDKAATDVSKQVAGETKRSNEAQKERNAKAKAEAAARKKKAEEAKKREGETAIQRAARARKEAEAKAQKKADEASK